MLEAARGGGHFASVAELATAQKINESYVCRVLSLTLLAPEIVEAILDGRQPLEVQIGMLLKPFLVEWNEQTQLSTVTNLGQLS